MELSDEALVLACRHGDDGAWETLVSRYQRLVYSVPRHAGLDEDLAAEVFQHVFATLVEQLDRLEQPARLAAWLVTTARRETWRVRQRERGRGSSTAGAGMGGPAEDVPDAALLPDEVLLRLEEQHLVRQAVAALGEPCHRLLTLLFYRPDPLSYAEIAALLGMPAGSIGPTRARCLAKLRRLLEERGF